MAYPNADAIMDQWHNKFKIDRWLLPRDFLNEVRSGDIVEERTCMRYTTKLLTVGERETIKTLKVKDKVKYSTPIEYIPTGFKNETVHVIRDGVAVNCETCYGRGTIDCPREVQCPQCLGTTWIREQCRNCMGSGTVTDSRGDFIRTVRCSSCRDGIFEEPCHRCLSPHGAFHGSTGRVTCMRCNGTGELPCHACASEGQVIQARILTRKFSRRTDVVFNIDGLDKNGIKRRHFWRFKGNLLSDNIKEDRNSADVVRRQETTEVFYIQTATFTYKGKPFTVSAIAGEKEKFVTSKVPFAKKRLAAYYAASAILGIAAVGALLAIAAFMLP